MGCSRKWCKIAPPILQQERGKVNRSVRNETKNCYFRSRQEIMGLTIQSEVILRSTIGSVKHHLAHVLGVGLFFEVL